MVGVAGVGVGGASASPDGVAATLAVELFFGGRYIIVNTERLILFLRTYTFRGSFVSFFPPFGLALLLG